MLFTLKEIKVWLQITTFELCMILVASLTFVVLLTLKLDNFINISWWQVFGPLLVCDTLVAYFNVLVFIQLVLSDRTSDRSFGVKRLLLNTVLILLITIYLVLMCQHLEGEREVKMSVIHTPIFIWMLILLFRTCIIADQV